MLPPIAGFSLVLTAVTMSVGLRRSYHVSWIKAFVQAASAMIYMLHWIPVIASVTLRMCVQPKLLKWVKTQHQGAGNTLLEDIELQEVNNNA